MKALSFNGVTLTPVYHNTQIHLTASELAKALGYACADSVTRIYNRNADEFSADMTQLVANPQTVNLTVRIFSLRGCHLVGMFARTPVAKEFRKWVLDVLAKEVGEPVITPAPKPQSPKLSQSDYATVRRAVYFLSKNMYHTGTATNVIYARLRSLCEVEHMADIRYDQLTIVQNELYRIERILRAYTNYRQQTEKTLMSRICMGDSEVVGQAMIAMETTATAYAQVFDEATSAVAYANKVAGEGK